MVDVAMSVRVAPRRAALPCAAADMKILSFVPPRARNPQQGLGKRERAPTRMGSHRMGSPHWRVAPCRWQEDDGSDMMSDYESDKCSDYDESQVHCPGGKRLRGPRP